MIGILIVIENQQSCPGQVGFIPKANTSFKIGINRSTFILLGNQRVCCLAFFVPLTITFNGS